VKKLILALLLALALPGVASAACPFNDLLYNKVAPVTFQYEKRNGTGEDTTNTANKRLAISYWNGSAMRWWNGSNWNSTTEQALTMTQVSGGQYRYNFTPGAVVSGEYVLVKFWETDDVDVTAACVAYVQPENRWVVADEKGTDSAATASALATAQADLDTLTGSDGATLATSQPNYAPATASALTTHDGKLDTVDGLVDNIVAYLCNGTGTCNAPTNIGLWDRLDAAVTSRLRLNASITPRSRYCYRLACELQLAG